MPEEGRPEYRVALRELVKMPVKKSYWLMKSDPDVYDIDDLKKERTCYWDGVKGPSGTRYPTHR